MLITDRDLGFDKSGGVKCKERKIVWKCTLGLALKSYSLQSEFARAEQEELTVLQLYRIY